ncbi:MAG TPA: hypothetical protein VFB73_11665 [Chloroflexota bacterium]|nr:hypothetical protein [Chloroflexota bacterium]
MDRWLESRELLRWARQAGEACRAQAARRVLVSLVLAAAVGACVPPPSPRVPPPPMVGSSGQIAAPRPPRATPGPEVRTAVASGDVVEAAQAYVYALYTADDETAALYQPGYGTLLRKDEDQFELLDLTARPMSWGEAGYPDADPSLEFAEVVARVRARNGSSAGTIYYKIGFKRQGDTLSIDLMSRRMDVR